jgi:hypothetical protein
MHMTKKSLPLRICLSIAFLAAGAISAFAVPPGQVFKIASDQLQFNGPCCFSFDETVSVTEPAKPQPVVLTWSATSVDLGDEFVGLMVNGGPCAFYGPGSIPGQGNSIKTHTAEWIVFPSDGLKSGTNTFTLCGGGGGVSGDQSRFVVFVSTLSALISK